MVRELTPKEQTTMEALAKFYRLRPDAEKQGRGNVGLDLRILRRLEDDLGLVHTVHGRVVRTYKVFLTDEGKQAAMGICFDQGRKGG